MEDWEVSASDDEWSVYNPPEAKKVDSLFIPDRLACLFKKIEEDKVVAITGGYLCVGSNKEATQTNNNNGNNNNNNNTPSNTTPPPSQEGHESQAAAGDGEEAPEDNNKSFEAFNFEEGDAEKPSLKRKSTPGSSAKRGKKEKVGSMSNVMSDLLRHKYLDELEAKKDEPPAVSVPENKPPT